MNAPCDPTVASLVADQARLRPRATALADRRRRVSYGGLMREAHRLANHLITKPVAPGDVVAIGLEPSCDFAAALLAVWQCGAIALPVDLSFPPARLEQVLRDAGCRWVVSLSMHAETIRGVGAVGVCLDASKVWIERQPARAPQGLPAQRLAYLLYTSGSTGEPKGVAVPHTALFNKIAQPGAWGVLDAGCRALWHGSPAFDASLAQLLLPLAHGGRVRALDSEERMDRRRLWAALRAQRTTVLDCTPSWLAAMLDAAPAGLPLERIVTGGEILTPGLARRLRQHFPQARIVNVYGPTEACIDATAHELDAADFDGETIPIGRPLPGYRVQLLDQALQPVPPGEAGELCIGGVGLADGYWNQAQATERRFVADPRLAGERLYRSGDLARQRADGAIEFLGRSDQQIKLRGQRIELGEIEAALARVPGVTAGVVRTWPSPAGGDPVLVAHAVLSATTAAQVREYLRRELPACMVPAMVAAVASLPLLPTGKIDRQRLAPPTLVLATPTAARTRDALEATLLETWREILRVDCGPHDNFFEIGGDSLAAVELAQRIGERLNVEVPLATLLSHPSVADLALALVRGRQAVQAHGRVLDFGGSRGGAAPLFVLPPGSGASFVYAGLARELRPQLRCVGLQAVAIPGGAPGTHGMAALAAQFADDIEAVQPAGALRLCGYSAGGAVAHALVGELARRGHRVDTLVLLDPYCWDHADHPDGLDSPAGREIFRAHCGDMLWDAFALRGAAAEPLLQAAERLLDHGLACADALDQAASGAARQMLARARRALPAGTSLQVFLMLLEGVTNLSPAYAGHAAQPLQGYDGQTWFIQPEGDAAALRAARLATWRPLVGGTMDVHVVPGEHATMLQRAPSVAAIAQAVRSACEPRSRVA